MFSPSLAGSPYRAALALAEAIIPGSPSIPAADETTVARAQDIVRELHPSLVRAWGAAQQAFDAAAVARTGRPFHALSAAKQEELLVRWGSDPLLKNSLSFLSLVYRFVHFDRGDVYGALGGKLNVVPGLESPRWLSQVHATGAWDEGAVECDVVVVGTGAGGGVVGRELAERGYAVVFVGGGEHYRRDAFDGRAVNARQEVLPGCLLRGERWPSPSSSAGSSGGPPPSTAGRRSARRRGSSSAGANRWGATSSPRARWSRTSSTSSATWRSARRGEKTSARSGDFIARGCDALGWSHSPVMRNAPGCNGLGFCDFGCRTDARRGTNLSYVPAAALQKGRSCSSPAGRSSACSSKEGRRSGSRAVAANGRERAGARAGGRPFSGGSLPAPPLPSLAAGAGEPERAGGAQPLDPSERGLRRRGRRAHPPRRDTSPRGMGSIRFLREGILVLARATRRERHRRDPRLTSGSA